MFKRKAPPPEVEPFRSWEIVTVTATGSRYQLRGSVFEDMDPVEALRYVEAIADGLRRAGFSCEVDVIRETRSTH